MASAVSKIAISYSARPKMLLCVLWTACNLYLLLKNGIVTSGEAEKYIREAHTWLETGRVSTDNFWLYFTQIYLLAFCIKLKLGFAFAIGIQLILNLAATFSFYGVLIRSSGNTGAALLGTILLLVNLPYQEFNTYLQTESIFYSLTLLLSCYLINIGRLSLKNIFVVAIMLIVLMVTRPTGLLFLPPTLIYLFLISRDKKRPAIKIMLAILCSLFFLYILDKALSSGGELDFMLPFKNQSVVCGVPSPSGPVSIDASGNGSSVFGLYYFVTHNFGLFIRLSFQKTIAFFGLYRSYYSTGHNILLLGYFYGLYIAFGMSIGFWVKKSPEVSMYIISLILITWFSVMLTCDDWHNRFFLTLSPYFILISTGLLSRIQKNPVRI